MKVREDTEGEDVNAGFIAEDFYARGRDDA